MDIFFAQSAAPLAVLTLDGAVVRSNAAFARVAPDGAESREIAAATEPGASARFTTRGARFEVTRADDDLLYVVGVAEEGPATDIPEARTSGAVALFARVIETAPIVLWAIDPQGAYTLSEGRGLEPSDSGRASRSASTRSRCTRTSPRSRGRSSARRRRDVAAQSPAPGVHFDNWYLPLRDERGRDDWRDGASRSTRPIA